MGLFKGNEMAGKPEGWYPDRERCERYWTGSRWDARRYLLADGSVSYSEDWYTDSKGVYHRVYPPLEEELQAERSRKQEETKRVHAGKRRREPTANCLHCGGERTVLVEPVKGHKVAATVAFGIPGALAAKGDHTKMRCTACGAEWTLK